MLSQFVGINELELLSTNVAFLEGIRSWPVLAPQKRLELMVVPTFTITGADSCSARDPSTG